MQNPIPSPTHKLLDHNLSRIWSSLIIHEFIQNKITHFYLSPGMRNAPLIAALDHLQHFYPTIEIFICIDERAAAFRALGYSKGTGRAAVLLCTSGTAMANYMPAVIEAKKSNIPLVIVSADRPCELTHCDDNQTIDQTKFYGDFVQGELNLGAPSLDISPLALTSSLSNLIHKAFFPQMGPVHFNAPFREPLEETRVDIPASYLKLAELKMTSESPSTQYLDLEIKLADHSFDILAQQLNQSRKGLLVIGPLGPHEILNGHSSIIEEFIQKLNWPTYFDISSSLKYKFNLNDKTLPTFDHPEVQEILLNNPPDTIFHIGGRLTSKHYYTFLKQLPEINLITLNKNVEKEDPSHHTKMRINADIAPTLCELIKRIHDHSQTKTKELSPPYFSRDAFFNMASKKSELIDQGPLSFPKISKTIIDHIDDHSVLYLGNSTAVRSFDSYLSLSNRKNITVATNRGVSGIEGLIASSIGLIDGIKKSIFLVLGDISFIHDLNSLHFLRELKTPLKIILINNFSGGIFTLLPINQEEKVIKYIASPHDFTFSKASEFARISYQSVKEAHELRPKFLALKETQEHCLLEIFIDNDLNKKVYDLLKTIKL